MINVFDSNIEEIHSSFYEFRELMFFYHKGKNGDLYYFLKIIVVVLIVL